MDRRLPVNMRFTLQSYSREQLAEIIRRQFSAKQYDVQCSNEEIASALVDIDDKRLHNLNAGIWKQLSLAYDILCLLINLYRKL